MQITTIGLDLAKSVFQAHCVRADGEIVRKKLRRAQVMEFSALNRRAWCAASSLPAVALRASCGAIPRAIAGSRAKTARC